MIKKTISYAHVPLSNGFTELRFSFRLFAISWVNTAQFQARILCVLVSPNFQTPFTPIPFNFKVIHIHETLELKGLH